MDLDDRTANILGVGSAGDGLRAQGEATFRKAEVEALRAALDERGDAIVALGGGTPTAPGAAEMIRFQSCRRAALVLYLGARPELLRERLGELDAAERPPLTPLGTIGEVDRLYEQRDPLYRSLASHVIDGEGKSPREIADLIDRAWLQMDRG